MTQGFRDRSFPPNISLNGAASFAPVGHAPVGHAADGHSGASTAGQQRWALWHWIVFAVFSLSSFVMIEPSPFEVFFIPVMFIVAFKARRLLTRPSLVQGVLVSMLFLVLGAVSIQFSTRPVGSVIYHLITVYMYLIFIVVALAFQTGDERLQRAILCGFITGIVVSSLLGIAEMMAALPSGFDGVFTKYDRLKGTYKDPNVFGPAAGLAAQMLIFWRSRTGGSLFGGLARLVLVAIVVLAIFLTYSRASMAFMLVTTLATALLLFAAAGRWKVKPISFFIFFSAITGGVVLVATVAPLFIDVEFLSSRLAFQWYDFDRFKIQGLALRAALGEPLGLGPGQSEYVFVQFAGIQKTGATHNTYIRVLIENGWLALLCYQFWLIMIFVAALAALARVTKHPRLAETHRFSLTILCLSLTTLWITSMMGMIIDTLHWRHFFIASGLCLGAACRLLAAQRVATFSPHLSFFEIAPGGRLA